jgi:hypothetical protein
MQPTFKQYKESFIQVNGETDLYGNAWTDGQIREDARLNGIELAMRYGITTYATVASKYTVEANSPEEAEEKFGNGDWTHMEELAGAVDSNEEVISIEPLNE